MKVELLVSRVTAERAENRGEVVEVSNDEAARMIEAGQAIPVRSVKPEKATPKRKAEKASK